MYVAVQARALDGCGSPAHGDFEEGGNVARYHAHFVGAAELDGVIIVVDGDCLRGRDRFRVGQRRGIDGDGQGGEAAADVDFGAHGERPGGCQAGGYIRSNRVAGGGLCDRIGERLALEGQVGFPDETQVGQPDFAVKFGVVIQIRFIVKYQLRFPAREPRGNITGSVPQVAEA